MAAGDCGGPRYCGIAGGSLQKLQTAIVAHCCYYVVGLAIFTDFVFIVVIVVTVVVLAAAAAGFVASFCSDIAAAATGVDRVHTYIYTFIQWHTYLYQPTTSFCAVFLLFARHRQLQLQMSL